MLGPSLEYYYYTDLWYILVSILSCCLKYIVAVSEVVAVVDHTNLEWQTKSM